MRINLRLLVAFLAFVVSVSLQAAVQQEKRISGTVISDGESITRCFRTGKRCHYRYHYRYRWKIFYICPCRWDTCFPFCRVKDGREACERTEYH